MIKITYTKDGEVKERYALTEQYAQLRRDKLTAENIQWTEEFGMWQNTLSEEVGAWQESN